MVDAGWDRDCYQSDDEAACKASKHYEKSANIGEGDIVSVADCSHAKDNAPHWVGNVGENIVVLDQFQVKLR